MPEPSFLLTKNFQFSSSHESGSKVFGHNYIFSITVDLLSADDELRLSNIIEKKLITKIHSRDLSLHVDFLQGVTITDQNLLSAFYRELKPEISFCSVKEVSLQRDSRTQTRMLFQ